MKRAPVAAALALLLASLGGCSLRDARIATHRDAFDDLPADVQERVREGRLAVGDTPEVVKLAWGSPNRKHPLETAQGPSEVWSWWKAGSGATVSVGSHRPAGRSGVGGYVEGGAPAKFDVDRQVVLRDGRVVEVHPPLRTEASTP